MIYCKVVFCTKKVGSTSAKLLSNVEDGNALKFSDSVTVTDALEIEEGTIPANAAQFVVEAGVTADTFAFKAAEGYLFGTYDGSASDLYFKAAKDNETSWTVSLSDSYAATIYNTTHSRYLNNYYGSKFNFAGSVGTYYYYIYYIDGAATEEPETPETPVVTPLEAPVVTATATANTVTVEWTAVEGAKDYTVVCGEQSVTVTATTATFENVAAGSYKVVVTANPADETLHVAATSTAVEVVVEDAPAQGGEAQTLTLAFPADMPAGVSSGASVGTLYDGDITISSTGSWRTDNGDGRDAIYIGRTTNHNLTVVANNGKVITKITLTAPVGNQYQIDLKAKDNDTFNTTTFATTSVAEWTGECKSRVVFTAAGNVHSNIATITVEYK